MLGEKEQRCRLCSGDTHPLFQKRQLGKYDAHYFRCIKCESVQTEDPYWIEEAYRELDFAGDTGMVERVLYCSSAILAIALKERFSRDDFCLDVGGGTGLLTRILRDHGLNAYWLDKYAANVFAKGFESDLKNQKKPVLISACEVWEHFAQPEKEIAALFAAEPLFIFCSTKLYAGQDKSWWYFNQDGQHIQFYSKKAMFLIAEKYNYHYQSDGSTYHLFSQKRLPRAYLKRVLRASWCVFKKAHRQWASRTVEDSQRTK